MSGPRSRNAALLGALFVILVAAGFLISGDTPDLKASALRVKSEYDNHEAKHLISTYLVILGSIALLFFAAHLRGVLRSIDPAGRTAGAAYAGAVVSAGGFLFAAAVHGALTEAANENTVSGPALQALNALDNWTFPPFVGGLGVMVLATGLGLARGARGVLPGWFGWLGVVIGVVAISPVGFFGFVAGGLWVLVLSILLYSRWEDIHRDGAPPVAPAAA
jgi:hypothetical protein